MKGVFFLIIDNQSKTIIASFDFAHLDLNEFVPPNLQYQKTLNKKNTT